MIYSKDPLSGSELTMPPVPLGVGAPADEINFPPRLGEHNSRIYGEIMKLDVKKLKEENVI